MTLPDIAIYRLSTQQLSSSKFKKSTELVKWFGAIQAQEYAQTKWSIGLRLPQLNDKKIEKDLSDGKLIRTHLLRPTWHLVAAEDLRWMLMLTAPRVNAVNAYMYRKMELDAKIFKRCHQIITKALQGNQHLTREVLNNELATHHIKADGTRSACIFMEAELAGLICSGAKQGNQFTYALLEERVKSVKAKTHDEALAELSKRYFKSRGPATLKDYATWSGLTLTDCKKGLEMVKSLFVSEVVEKETYYFEESISDLPKAPSKIELLPIYDEFIMGYKNREAILQFKHLLPAKPKAAFDNTIIYEGHIIGTWRRVIKPKTIELEYTLFKPFTKKQKELFEGTVNAFGKFYDLKINY